MSELSLTGVQRQRLQACLDVPHSAGFSRRALALLAVDDGQSVADVAAWLGVSRQSIYHWWQAFAESPCPETLADHYGVGRPSLWTRRLERLLRRGLGQRPDKWGYPGMNWTVPLLRQYLYDQAGVWLSEDTVRRQLQRLGYVWKRYRYVLPPDPEREKKNCNPHAFGPVAAAQCCIGGG
jgi:transposase